jgi:hypothetical protein
MNYLPQLRELAPIKPEAPFGTRNGFGTEIDLQQFLGTAAPTSSKKAIVKEHRQ